MAPASVDVDTRSWWGPTTPELVAPANTTCTSSPAPTATWVVMVILEAGGTSPAHESTLAWVTRSVTRAQRGSLVPVAAVTDMVPELATNAPVAEALKLIVYAAPEAPATSGATNTESFDTALPRATRAYLPLLAASSEVDRARSWGPTVAALVTPSKTICTPSPAPMATSVVMVMVAAGGASPPQESTLL